MPQSAVPPPQHGKHQDMVGKRPQKMTNGLLLTARMKAGMKAENTSIVLHGNTGTDPEP